MIPATVSTAPTDSAYSLAGLDPSIYLLLRESCGDQTIPLQPDKYGAKFALIQARSEVVGCVIESRCERNGESDQPIADRAGIDVLTGIRR
jgi:hypothetical protein